MNTLTICSEESAALSPLEAFSAPEVRPKRVSIFYRLGMVVGAAVMVLLPSVYLALIGLLAYGVYWHATEHSGLVRVGAQLGRAGRMDLRLLAYGGPIVVGAILLIFLIKPLFARRASKITPYSLNPRSEPLLFAFIEKISRLVRAPMPTRVDLDCRLNASASLRRGALSLAGNDLVLTIGLPLVAGMDMRQFAGVLAHELGHFAQGGGMKLTYLVRSINNWFARVVYERDT